MVIVYIATASNCGLYIATASNCGLYIAAASSCGLYIAAASYCGLYIAAASNCGLYIAAESGGGAPPPPPAGASPALGLRPSAPPAPVVRRRPLALPRCPVPVGCAPSAPPCRAVSPSFVGRPARLGRAVWGLCPLGALSAYGRVRPSSPLLSCHVVCPSCIGRFRIPVGLGGSCRSGCVRWPHPCAQPTQPRNCVVAPRVSRLRAGQLARPRGFL